MRIEPWLVESDDMIDAAVDASYRCRHCHREIGCSSPDGLELPESERICAHCDEDYGADVRAERAMERRA